VEQYTYQPKQKHEEGSIEHVNMMLRTHELAVSCDTVAAIRKNLRFNIMCSSSVQFGLFVVTFTSLGKRARVSTRLVSSPAIEQ
jgi:hypothetical protein